MKPLQTSWTFDNFVVGLKHVTGNQFFTYIYNANFDRNVFSMTETVENTLQPLLEEMSERIPMSDETWETFKTSYTAAAQASVAMIPGPLLLLDLKPGTVFQWKQNPNSMMMVLHSQKDGFFSFVHLGSANIEHRPTHSVARFENGKNFIRLWSPRVISALLLNELKN